LPHPLENPKTFAAGVERVVSTGGYAILLPGSDASLLALSRARDRIEPHATMALPPHQAVVASLSKVALIEAAADAGLAAPETVVCTGVNEALSVAERVGYPVMLKPESSLVEVDRIPVRASSLRVDAPDPLARLVPSYGSPCLIQRANEGSVVSFAGILADGRLLGTAMSRYLRTWYPRAGNACFSESIEAPASLRERIIKLLEALEWEGLFELELIERPDGSYAAIDLNPRIYGSLALAVSAGANLPALWCEWLLGREPQRAVARPGLRYRWEEGDLRHLNWSLRRGDLRDAAAIVRPRHSTVHPYFSARDPGPLVAWAYGLVRLTVHRPRPVPPVSAAPDARDPAPRSGGRVSGEVAIIGAGPYGLAAAAHLRHAGIPVRIFGEVLGFWRSQMPEGMILRSRKRSSHIADPQRRLTIDDFEADTGRSVTMPSLTLEEFIDYGRWFQEQARLDVDPRKVRLLRQVEGGFRLVLEDGEELNAERAVVAAGLFPFGRHPEPFGSLPAALVSHSADHRDLSIFADRSVLVVGGGQSALESAALVRESGASVEVAIRASEIRWLLPDGARARRIGVRSRLPLPPTDVGGFASGWAAALPDAFRRLPEGLKPIISDRCIRPAASDWLRPRLEGVPLGTEAIAVGAQARNGQVKVDLADGSERIVDHILLGTGYEIDVSSYPFLSPELASAIEVEAGYPKLGAGFESSVPGLHFVGAPAARTFGPIMRFVVGTWYAAPSLTRRLLGRRQRPLQTAF
jgi:thioredoxin reductase/predicted ATP-grasp superfamily ATP-dependent carboligase